MKHTVKTFGWMMVLYASAAHAATGEEGDGMSLLGYLFLGFFALVIVSQLIPAGILFFGMVKSLFSAREHKKAVE
jgi:hypothetical protein